MRACVCVRGRGGGGKWVGGCDEMGVSLYLCKRSGFLRDGAPYIIYYYYLYWRYIITDLNIFLAYESLDVFTVCIWNCQHARFCVEVFYALYKKMSFIRSFIYSMF